MYYFYKNIFILSKILIYSKVFFQYIQANIQRFGYKMFIWEFNARILGPKVQSLDSKLFVVIFKCNFILSKLMIKF